MSDKIQFQIEDSAEGPLLVAYLFNIDEDGELLECGSAYLKLSMLKAELDTLTPAPITVPIKRQRKKKEEND